MSLNTVSTWKDVSPNTTASVMRIHSAVARVMVLARIWNWVV